MEKLLTVKKIVCPSIEAAEVPAILDKAGVAFQPIDCVDWEADYPYAPNVSFRLAHTGSSLLIEYEVEEDSVASVAGHDNGRVSKNSCILYCVFRREDGIRAACTKGRMIREMAHQL